MGDESHAQRAQGKRKNLLWGALAGLALGILFAVYLYFVLENASLSSFLDQWWSVVLLAYALLVGLLFFVIGFLRGRATENPSEGVIVIVSASLFQVPIALALLALFSWVFTFWYMDHYGVLFALFGIDIESGSLGAGWVLTESLIPQMLLGAFVAYIGGLIGSSFLHRQPRAG